MNTRLQLLGAMVVVSICGRAQATHKTFVLKHSGLLCSFDSPSTDDYYLVGLKWWPYPDPGYGKYAECPVVLSGRWGSSGTYSFSPPRSASSMWANVYVSSPDGGPFSCYAIARMNNDALYFSATGTSTGSGDKTVPLMNPVKTWGGTLDAHSAETLKAMDIRCSVPSGGYINAYKVDLCQPTNTNCNGQANDADESYNQFSDGLTYPIQTSGIECYAENDYGHLQRDLYGISNIGPDTGEDYVKCPLTPPIDDSYYHPRTLGNVQVYYSGGGGPGCTDTWPPTCPLCQVQSADYLGSYSYSSYFTYQPYGYVYGSSISVGRERVMNVACELPAGQRISGVTASSTVTDISGGT